MMQMEIEAKRKDEGKGKEEEEGKGKKEEECKGKEEKQTKQGVRCSDFTLYSSLFHSH